MLTLESSSAEWKDLLALRLTLPNRRIRKRAFFSVGRIEDKERIAPSVGRLSALGVQIYATEGTSRFLTARGIENTCVSKISEHRGVDAAALLIEGMFDLVVNVLTDEHASDEVADARIMRRLAHEHRAPIVTELAYAIELIDELLQDAQRREKARTPRLGMWEHFLGLVHERGGWVDNHGHYDKAYLMTPNSPMLGEIPMQEKWRLYRKLKEGYTPEDLFERISRCIAYRISKGVTHMRTMVDADSIVGLKCIEAALAAKRAFAGEAVIEVGIQPLEGVLESAARRVVEKACSLSDFIGGLPSRDNPRPEAHLDFIFAMGREMGKRVDVHVDQKGTPDEDETRLLALKTIEYGMEGRVAAVHSIIARKPVHKQREVAHLCKQAGITIIVCPGADISMEQYDCQAQMSNSLPPVPLYLEEGVAVAYGSDNTADPFMPYSEGEPQYEAHLLMDGCRMYGPKIVADIMCNRSFFGAN